MRALLLAFAGLTITASAAQAQFTARLEKIAVAGRPQRITSIVNLDPNCRPTTPPTIGLLDQPQQGQVTIERGRAFPNFPSANRRSKCNGREVAALWITYAAPAGATGDDAFTVEWADELGSPRRVHYHVTIR